MKTTSSLLRGALLLCLDALELASACPPHAIEVAGRGIWTCLPDCPGCRFEVARHAALEAARLALDAGVDEACEGR